MSLEVTPGYPEQTKRFRNSQGGDGPDETTGRGQNAAKNVDAAEPQQPRFVRQS